MNYEKKLSVAFGMNRPVLLIERPFTHTMLVGPLRGYEKVYWYKCISLKMSIYRLQFIGSIAHHYYVLIIILTTDYITLSFNIIY